MEVTNLKLYDPMFSGNERKRDSVGRKRSYMQISSNSVYINLRKECKLVTF